MTTSEENRTINDEIKSYGYPSKLQNTKIKDNHGQHLTPDNVKYVSDPCVRGSSEKIGKLLSSFNIKLATKSSNTFTRTFCHLKDKVKKGDTSEIVYEVKCSDCEKVYIGEFGRELGTRIKETPINGKQIRRFTNTLKKVDSRILIGTMLKFLDVRTKRTLGCFWNLLLLMLMIIVSIDVSICQTNTS